MYLIAVLAVAIRRGQVAALAVAVVGVLTLNYFFIKPLHQLTIADSDNVVALGALLLAPWLSGASPLRFPARPPRPSCGRAGRCSRARGSDARRCRDRPARRDRRPGGRDLRRPGSTAGRGDLRSLPVPHPRPETPRSAFASPTDALPVWLYACVQRLDRGRSQPDRDAPCAPDRCRRREHDGRRPQRRGRGRATSRCGQDRDLSRRLSTTSARRCTAVRSAAAGLREEQTTPQDRVALIDAIEEESDRLTRLIGNLLDLSLDRGWCGSSTHRLVRPARRDLKHGFPHP